MIFWMLAREVNILKGEVDKDDDEWNDVMVDLFYYRNVKDLKDPEAIEQAEAGEASEEAGEEEEDEGKKEQWGATNQ